MENLGSKEMATWPARLECQRVTIEALSAAFFAPGYNNEGCASLPVPPPSAIQGLVAAATGNSTINGFYAGWMMTFYSIYEDYEKIIPARRAPNAGDFEPYRTGYRLNRTPVKRKYLIEPRLTLYLERALAEAISAPYHTLRLGRSQDLAWVSSSEEIVLEATDEGEVQGVVVPFPLPVGGMASFLWVVPSSAGGYDRRQWHNPQPHAFLTKAQHLRGLQGKAFYRDAATGKTMPFYLL
jgi:CRISPR-associated protein Cas5t